MQKLQVAAKKSTLSAIFFLLNTCYIIHYAEETKQ